MCQILNPLALFQHICTQSTFDEVGALTDHVKGENADARKTAQAEGDGDAEAPDETAVKNKGDHGLSAGTEGEVGCVGVGVKGRHKCGDADQWGCQQTDAVGGVVHLGQNTGEAGHQQRKEAAGHNRCKYQLAVGVADLALITSGTQQLTHDNANSIAHGQEYHAGHIKEGVGNILSRDHIQTAGGVALVHNGHAAGPEEFVDQQRHTLDDDGLEQFTGNVQAAIGAYNIRILLRVAVNPECNNGKLHITGKDRCQSGTFHAHGRGAEMTEDQDVVANKIDKHSEDSRNHGDRGLSGFTQGAGIGIDQSKGREAPDDHSQIFQTVFHDTGGSGGIAVTGEIKSDESGAEQLENSHAQNAQSGTDQHLEPERMTHTGIVVGTMELSGKNTCTGAGSENAKVKDKNQAVDNGDTAHGNGAHLTDHDVIQQGYEIGDAVLDDHGDSHHKKAAVKSSVTYITLKHS